MSGSSRRSLDEHFSKKKPSSSSGNKQIDWDDTSGASLGDLSLNSDIRAMSREAHALLNQILNDTSESTATATTPGAMDSRLSSSSSPARRARAALDTSYDDEELEEELGRVDHDVSADIRALSAQLNAVHTNERGEVVAPILAESVVAVDKNNQLEVLESVNALSCTPSTFRNKNDATNDGSTMVRFDPAVEELKALRAAISNKDIAPPPPRGRAMKKEAPGRLEEGVDQVILVVCIVIWTIIVIIVDHTRTAMMDHLGVLQLPWVFRMFS